MEDTQQSFGAAVNPGLPSLPDASSDSKVHGAEQPTIGVLEAVKGLPEFAQELIVTQHISHDHYVEAKATSKKLKRSNSGEVTDFTDGAAISPRSLKLDADDPLELNMPAQGPPATTGESYSVSPISSESNQLAQGWSLFRMLIPTECDDQVEIENIIGEQEAKICIHDVAGNKVVVVWAKEDPLSSTSPAVEGLVRVHRYFMDKLANIPSDSPFDSPFLSTRLLMRAEQASSLLRSMTFWRSQDDQCFLSVYLTDNLPFFSGGDVIIKLQGIPERVNKVVRQIASHLRQVPLDERVILELENQGSTSSKGDSADNRTLDYFRSYEVQNYTRIPLQYVDRIVGENGVNIETIQRSSSATIILSPATSDMVHIWIHGDSTSDVDAVEEVMEGFIAKVGTPVFACMYECELLVRSSDEEDGEEWY